MKKLNPLDPRAMAEALSRGEVPEVILGDRNKLDLLGSVTRESGSLVDELADAVSGLTVSARRLRRATYYGVHPVFSQLPGEGSADD